MEGPMTASPGGPVRIERSGACLRVILDEPERRNALSPDLLESLRAALVDIPDDVRVVVLTGTGPVFSVGGDLRLRATGKGLLTDDIEESRRRLRRALEIVPILARMPQVTVAAINGACAGAGLSLAAACDIRIATARARFNTAFLTAGVSGDFGGIRAVTRLLGPGRARELYLLPGPFSADRAEQLGLVTRVVSEQEYPTAVDSVVDSLLGAAPLALRALKANLVDAETAPLEEYLEAEAERYVQTGRSSDSIEAANAYLHKRPPVFHGQ
jgi:2-(1,2-epoxy-1,2-dihydrophenyl)acetyl-CoA isomerase